MVGLGHPFPSADPTAAGSHTSRGPQVRFRSLHDAMRTKEDDMLRSKDLKVRLARNIEWWRL